MAGNKIHAQLIVTVTDAPSLDFHMIGCEQCLIASLSVLFEQNPKFKAIMRKAALLNTEVAIKKMAVRHDN